jgi:hypothetical protein
MKLPALYELAVAHRADIEALSDLDIDEQTFIDTMEGMSGDLETKAVSVVAFALSLEAQAKAIDEAIAKMQQRKSAYTNRAERIRTYVLTCMEIARVEKIECPHFVIKPRLNPASVQIVDETKIKRNFFRRPERPPPQVDKRKILDAWKLGIAVPGVEVTQTKRLEIK